MRTLCRDVATRAHQRLSSLQSAASFTITTTTTTRSPCFFSQKTQPQVPPPQIEQQRQQQQQHHHRQQQQQKHPPSYYAFFPRSLPDGAPPRGPFQIDPRALRSEFLSLQAKHHPDKQQQQSQSEQQPLSSTINQAYRTLLDPLLRAEYLLSQHGFPPTDESATLDQQDGVDEARLLALVMDAHEQVEEARSADDLHALQAENEARIAESERILGRAFAEGDWAGARREAVRLKYWGRIRGAVRDWEGGE
ncbi:hypothetical protein E4U43_004785 [Claviceps pusilla]|uniref:Co-chaperone HscB C-terminal oligomerisation domain-containing protein n=1 Tax=Claviceps pusilla TaxID=123648 RepID=A0A9P7N2X1_9HYPO|nr:hypothetical protein E4U43_004785 [Claviceps pusilla]